MILNGRVSVDTQFLKPAWLKNVKTFALKMQFLSRRWCCDLTTAARNSLLGRRTLHRFRWHFVDRCHRFLN